MRFLVIILALAAFLAMLVVKVPLGFVLERAGLPNGDVKFSSVEGTVWSGRLNGVEAAGQPIGDIVLNARPQLLLTGAFGYSVQWGGPAGRGTGQISVAPGRVHLKDVKLEQNLGALEGLTNTVRAFGGVLRLRDGQIRLTESECLSAGGTITSDILTKAGASYGRAFGPISGDLRCENGAIVIALKSSSEVGDKVDAMTEVWLNGRSEVEVDVTTNDVELGAALAEL
ncbi:MAG: type II secretion system protein N, partial [Pseudomonadota bacterium]